MKKNEKKPIGVYIISIIIMLSFIITMPILFLLTIGLINSGIKIPPILFTQLMITFVMGTINFILAIGLLMFKKWAHLFMLIFARIGILIGAVSFIVESFKPLVDLPIIFSIGIGMLFNIIILIYLPKKNIKSHFK